MPESHTAKPDISPDLDRIAAALGAGGVAAQRPLATRARSRAESALAGWEGDRGWVASAFAGNLLAGLSVDPGATPQRLGDALAAIEPCAGIDAMSVIREALRSPELALLEPSLAVDAMLRLLVASAGMHSASLWNLSPAGAPQCLQGAGDGPPAGAGRRLARALILGEGAVSGARAEVVGVAIERAGQPVAALLGRAGRGRGARALALLLEAAGPLRGILERETLLARNASSERALVQASERRLTRLGFDLHDGPLQELLLLGEDLALFRGQLGVVLEGRRGKELLGGRLDDLDARLLALERGLRRISTSVHASVLVSRPFDAALADLVEPFAARTGVRPAVTLRGDLQSVSPSQRMALLAVLGEALNNVREHSGAESVTISIVQDEDGVRAQVRDDGHGFDVEGELLRAARRGHMGLAGVYERVRLLGGHCRVESLPGGPTEISLALPRWELASAEAPERPPVRGDRRRAAPR